MNKIILLLLLLLILFVANLESLLLLRHKSPYISDSYFYQHMLYRYLGDDYDQARTRVIETLSPITLDQISSNFFYNDANYRKTLKHFTKRPFYPWVVSIIYRFTNQEYFSFLLPQFFALNIVLVTAFYLFRQGLTDSWSIISTALLAAFPPLVEWTTYFTGDIIGVSFWLLQITLLLKLIQKPSLSLRAPLSGAWQSSLTMTFGTSSFLIILALSLFNREQSLLMNIVILVLMYSSTRLVTLWKFTAVISIIYLSVLKLTGQYTVFDTISYLRNSYGLSENVYTFNQNIPFILQSIVSAHQAFLMDVIHYRWWLAITLTGITGAISAMKRPKIIDSVMLASAIGSYAAIFIYPSFSYKYFFPIAISLIYFTVNVISHKSPSSYVRNISPPVSTTKALRSFRVPILGRGRGNLV